MELEPVKVKCHAGYKADEYPISFVWLEKEFLINEILDRWYQGDCDPELPPANYFKVKTADGGQYILKKERLFDSWYLVI